MRSSPSRVNRAFIRRRKQGGRVVGIWRTGGQKLRKAKIESKNIYSLLRFESSFFIWKTLLNPFLIKNFE